MPESPYPESWQQAIYQALRPFQKSHFYQTHPTGEEMLNWNQIPQLRIPWHFQPEPVPWRGEPVPIPWAPGIAYLISVLGLREVGNSIPEGPLRKQVVEGANRAISEFTDDICGTRPGHTPWPWPGPPPWIYPFVSELGVVANTMQSGSLKQGVMDVAGEILKKSSGAASGTRA